MDITKLQSIELVSLIKDKKISVLEVIDCYIRRIEEINPQLNAIVVKRFSEARMEAQKIDENFSSYSHLPLLGIPFTVKEIISVSGKPYTMACTSYKDRIAVENATVVKRLKDAGAIIIGITNLPELAFGLETDNLVYGRTNNPWDYKRTSGGSSGGDAAIVAANGASFGIGSDAGGSIRMPAFYCGVYGHKPSAHIVPLTGHFPLDKGSEGNKTILSPKCMTIGPLAKSPEDLLLILNIMCGPDEIDQCVNKDFYFDAQDISFENRNVLVCENPHIFLARKPSVSIIKCIREAGKFLEEKGAQLKKWHCREFKYAFNMWMTLFQSENEQSLCSILGNHREINPFYEFFKYLLGKPQHSLPAIFFAIGEKFSKFIPQKRITNVLNKLESLRLRLEEELDNKILLLPILPHSAPLHGMTMLHPFDFAYCGIFNALGFPATAIPMGKNSQSIPIGIQAISSHGRDDLTIATAMAIHKQKIIATSQ